MARADLRAAALDALNRRDLATVADTWIQAATSRLNTLLRHRTMLTRQVLSVTQPVFAAPADFIEVSSARCSLDPSPGSGTPGVAAGPLLYAPPDQITARAAAAAQATYLNCGNPPRYYTMHGRQFELAPWGGVGPYQFDLWYYAKLVLGPADTDTNFFLDEYPHVYLNGVMTFGHRFLLEPDAAMGYEQLFMAEVQAINDSESEAQVGAGPLIVQPPNTNFSTRRGGRFR